MQGGVRNANGKGQQLQRNRVSKLIAILMVKKRGIRGNPPLLDNTLLAHYSTGLFNGEGFSYCLKSIRSRYPRIGVAMCDRDALEPVGRWWGVRVIPRSEKAKVCANGPAYQIAASGARAKMIMSEMIKYGLSSRKIEQWRKVLSLCRDGA